jgi:glutamate-ammonia-ligase adenylyltransferase
VISASPELLASIEAAIREVLCRPRDRQKLAADVADMRRRIARDKPSRNPWELKLYDGGLLDIEFICQFLQLAHAAEAPEILHPNTCTALRNLADAGRLAPDRADDLIAASRLYRSLMGVLRVAIDGELDPDDAPLGVKGALARAAGEADFAALDRRVSATQATVRRLFAGIVLATAGEDATAQAGQ